MAQRARPLRDPPLVFMSCTWGHSSAGRSSRASVGWPGCGGSLAVCRVLYRDRALLLNEAQESPRQDLDNGLQAFLGGHEVLPGYGSALRHVLWASISKRREIAEMLQRENAEDIRIP